MIIIAALLGLMDVFIFRQLDIWGAIAPMGVVLIYAFRNDARADELILASALYGFVVSVFLSPISGLIEMLAICVPAVATIFMYRSMQETRLKGIIEKLRHLYFSAIFTAGYFAITGLRFLGDYSVTQFAGTFGVSVCVIGIALVAVDLFPLRRRTEALL